MTIHSLLASFAAAFSQEQRLLTLHLGDGQRWGETLLPLAVHGDEAVSDSYRYRVECLSPDAGLELKSLLGVPVRLGLAGADGTEQVRGGVVSAVDSLGADGGFAKYALTVEPPFALLRLRRTSRVFQDLSVPDIVRQVFAEHAAANPVFAAVQRLDFVLAGELPSRSYCLQYRESDYDFLVRLLHEEGLAWRFEHGERASEPGRAASRGALPQVQLVAFDDPYSPPAAGVERVRFHRSDATEEEDGLTRWDGTRQIVSGGVTLASFDYQPVATGHSGDSSAVEQGSDGTRLQSSLQDYDVPGPYYAGDADQLAHYARLRQQAHDAQAKRFDGGGSVRGLAAGQWFRLDDHPAHEGDAPEQREFVVTRQAFTARNNLPTDLARALPPSLRPTSTAGAGADTSASDVPYHTTFSAQRRGLPLTPAYAGTALAKPTARGAQTATVVGPAGEEIHTDAHGRIKVQFHWQRPDEHPTIGANLDDTSSCWLRVAMPAAGAGWGHQFIPRIGQEVLVDFLEGDIDRPIITGVLYNGSHPPPAFSGAGKLPGNQTLSGIKSKEHHGGQYNELLFDDTPGEVRAKLSSEHGATQLNQGYLVHPRTDGKATPRGDGFELRTDRHGAIRAGHGLLLSTEAQPSVSGKQLGRDGAQSQLDAALSLSQSLGETATAQLADTVEIGPETIQPDNGKGAKKPDGHLQHHVAALKAWEAGTNTIPSRRSATSLSHKDSKTAGDQAGQQPLMVLSAPAGLAATTDNSLTLAAGTNIDQIAQRDTQQTSGRRWLHNVGQHISLFVAGVKDAVSLKLIAAKGKVQVQAQSDAMELTADKDVTVASCKDSITIAAKEEILLNVGGGAYIRMSGGNIEVHCSGTVSVKGENHVMSGPAQMNMSFPALSLAEARMSSAQVTINKLLMEELAASHDAPTLKYRFIDTSTNEVTQSGTLSKTGDTERVFTEDRKDLALVVENESMPWSLIEDHHYFIDTPEEPEPLTFFKNND
ncbi:type VI secretion system Vgr family protein [Pseudogulbenkiania sp. NH8B]|uniref:type VI secretion system Vgr family protein n=1 Tax=Pseudogulbenkiania sp. (strain NH8B) TaxID=748280 RepID=UPI000227A02C|nr:type VI secretion system Vgr family protein [Pseudogulbenkiania sp. NH8B]BAK76211.1 type VI secretion system Vgr family protein [Pseudogulbenkiania sp. NH8B]